MSDGVRLVTLVTKKMEKLVPTIQSIFRQIQSQQTEKLDTVLLVSVRLCSQSSIDMALSYLLNSHQK